MMSVHLKKNNAPVGAGSEEGIHDSGLEWVKIDPAGKNRVLRVSGELEYYPL
jgi:hypothetical protein